MFSFKNIKINKAPFPLLMIDNFISKESCIKIKNSILLNKKYDDLVMNGRKRINKGSDNFKVFINNNKEIKKMYYNLNKISFFNKINKYLDLYFKDDHWTMKNKILKFSKKNYGLQKGKKFTKSFDKIKKRNTLNLDIDFSCSENGYFREAHRDRETRVINFLLYLNTTKVKEGGKLEIFDLKKNKYKLYSRFPSMKDIVKKYSLKPVSSRFIFFRSTPNSYHGVSKFNSLHGKRVFLYGSYSLNNKVKWANKQSFLK